MFKFELQRFDNYNVSDLATVGQIKTLATRIAARLTALESRVAIRAVVVENNALKFYTVTADKITAETVPATVYNVPEEIYLSQTGTQIVENFAFSAETYPGATNPNLDGKTVLVLAVRGDDATNPTIKYSFVNMSNIFDDYVQKKTNATTDNIPVFDANGDLVNSTIASAGVFTTIAGSQQNNVMIFNAQGKVADSGHAIATDAQFTAMLDEVLPTGD